MKSFQFLSTLGRVLLLGLPLVLTACGLTPTRQPHLYGLVARAEPAHATWPSEAPLIAVGPIDLPDYVRRAQILTLSEEVEYRASSTGRWAEPVEPAVGRVIVENLARALGTGQVASLGAAPAGNRLQVTLQITDFVATDASEVKLGVFWRVLSADGRKLLRGARFEHREPLVGAGDAAVVNAMSTALAALTPELVTALQAARLVPQP
jgi:uncharacterized lipoprotein YmbA